MTSLDTAILYSLLSAARRNDSVSAARIAGMRDEIMVVTERLRVLTNNLTDVLAADMGAMPAHVHAALRTKRAPHIMPDEKQRMADALDNRVGPRGIKYPRGAAGNKTARATHEQQGGLRKPG